MYIVCMYVCIQTSKFQLLNISVDSSYWKSRVRKLSNIIYTDKRVCVHVCACR